MKHGTRRDIPPGFLLYYPDFSAGGKEEQNALLHRFLENTRQRLGIGHELPAVEFGARGDLLLRAHIVGFVVDDDELAVLLQAAVHHTLQKKLFPFRAGVEAVGIQQQGETKLPQGLFGFEHALSELGAEEPLNGGNVHRLRLAPG